jgi:FAD:protein FMN transferase
VLLSDEALSTSGSYEKFFKLDGKEYCHIFDPRTGSPVRGMLSATAIAKTGTMSDALSTAFFVMGLDETRAYCEKHPDIRAVLIPEPESGTPQPRRVNFPG